MIEELSMVKDPSIAKEKFTYSDQVKIRLDYEKWKEYVDTHQDYYTWYENTQDGIFKRANLDKVPEFFRDGELKRLNKAQAFAEFNQKKGWHEIVVDFHQDTGVIKTTFMKKITKAHLRRLLDMANYLDAYLLNNGNEIIDEQFIESLA